MQRSRSMLPSLPGYQVLAVAGPDKGGRLSIGAHDPGSMLVGTSPVCQLRLTDREVSRRHVALELRGSELHLSDLRSTNGTRVNGLRVIEAVLEGGESIEIGATTLRVERTSTPLQQGAPAVERFGRVIGASLAMRKLYPLCERLAQSDISVLIEGETGTGKEVMAESIHEASARARGPFVVFDCSTVAPSLMESHLFGHEKGAFTGATAPRKGVFELAHRGTLFIDEIGDLELGLQARLLRATERGEVCRVGSERWQKVDVRILAATRRDLDREVQARRFRDDLFFRLAVARVELPPLRNRQGDIQLLARHFWETLGGASKPPPRDLFARFEDMPWPGNVRELHNAVARRLAVGDLPGFGADSAPRGRFADDEADEDTARGPASAERPAPGDMIESVLAMNLSFPQARDRVTAEFERLYLQRMLDSHGGDVGKAAAASGIARRYFNMIRARHRG